MITALDTPVQKTALGITAADPNGLDAADTAVLTNQQARQRPTIITPSRTGRTSSQHGERDQTKRCNRADLGCQGDPPPHRTTVR
jgi:hypothetical protein